jgi:hypothetical protein
MWEIGNEKNFPFPNIVFFGGELGGLRSGHSLPSVRSSHVGRNHWLRQHGAMHHRVATCSLARGREIENGRSKKACARKNSPSNVSIQKRLAGDDIDPGATPRAAAATARETCPDQPINRARLLPFLLATSPEVIRLIFSTVPSLAPCRLPCVRQSHCRSGSRLSRPSTWADIIRAGLRRKLPVTLRRTERRKSLKESVNTGAVKVSCCCRRQVRCDIHRRLDGDN